MKTPVGPSTQLELLFSTFFFNSTPAFGSIPVTDVSKTSQAPDVHPYRIRDSVCEMFIKSSKIFGEPQVSSHFSDSCMQLTQWDAEVRIVGQTLFEGEE